jgi:hypothetical protein
MIISALRSVCSWRQTVLAYRRLAQRSALTDVPEVQTANIARAMRERENLRGEGSERHYQVLGGGVGNINCCLEGSQALPASPSDRV